MSDTKGWLTLFHSVSIQDADTLTGFARPSQNVIEDMIGRGYSVLYQISSKKGLYRLGEVALSLDGCEKVLHRLMIALSIGEGSNRRPMIDNLLWRIREREDVAQNLLQDWQRAQVLPSIGGVEPSSKLLSIRSPTQQLGQNPHRLPSLTEEEKEIIRSEVIAKTDEHLEYARKRNAVLRLVMAGNWLDQITAMKLIINGPACLVRSSCT